MTDSLNVMRSFLIDAKRGLILGSFSTETDKLGVQGWIFHPYTTARQASRRPWPTKKAASKRFRNENTRIIEAEDVKSADAIAQAEKAMFQEVIMASEKVGA